MGLLEAFWNKRRNRPESTRTGRRSRVGSDPAAAIEGDPAGRHDAVGMGVVVEGLTPAVQHGGDPDPRPEVLGIGGDLVRVSAAVLSSSP